MKNLMLITDVSRLQNIFALLADDPSLRVRVATSLEQGGELIAGDTPDMVFIQTHMSGLSPDILLMHLKKLLHGVPVQFVLMAATQPSAATLKLLQGWLNISQDNTALLADLKQLVASLRTSYEPSARVAPAPVVPASREDLQLPAEVSISDPEPPPVPRSRLSVYSEFSASFDHAVQEAPDAEPLYVALPVQELVPETSDIAQRASEAVNRKKTGLCVLVGLVVSTALAVTIYQQRHHAGTATQGSRTAQKSAAVSVLQKVATSAQRAVAMHPFSSLRTLPSGPQVAVPAFIPQSGRDAFYSAANPGWERYTAQGIEYRLYRAGGSVKALQIMALGGADISRTFLNDIVRQLTGNTGFVIDSSEHTDGYRIERGRLSDAIKIAYYRDEQKKTVKAVVLTWH